MSLSIRMNTTMARNLGKSLKMHIKTKAKIFLDMSNYMISEDDASALNGSTKPLGFYVAADVEVGRGL
ncbi:hypothetical protein L6452_07222 [Arctium lappa]|uniref:Uncharacterized protein n=1 Tax=Arctium lappa TaxID=4217 RepID=A0ACB9ELC9_ARCLA|nr:hypothetical protein L6452_07222 [Arctium lappa]